MKQRTNRVISCLLVALFFVAGISSMAWAAVEGGDKVLTGVAHTAAVAAVDVTGKTAVTLTVPYAYEGTVDLEKGLTLGYDNTIYPAAIAQFPNGAVAEVAGAAVTMLVVYQRPDDEVLYQTEYTVSVVRQAGKAPAFAGKIEKSLTAPGKVVLTEGDFTANYSKNDGADLDFVKIEGATPAFGGLKLSGRVYESGTPISRADLKKGAVTFEATLGGDVSYTVTAYGVGDDQKAVGTGVLQIRADSAKAEDIFLSTKFEQPVKLVVNDFNLMCKRATGEDMAYVTFSLPAASYGKLYFGYTSGSKYESAVTSSTKYYRNDTPQLAKISFVPKTGYIGTATINYTAYGESGKKYAGKLLVTVEKPEQDIITGSTDDRTPLTLPADQISTVFTRQTGKRLSSVTFSLPSSSYGRLYYDYRSTSNVGTAVSVKTRYYRNDTPYLARVTFVPTIGYSGKVTISYTASGEGATYEGQLQISVARTRSEQLVYQTAKDVPVAFSATDFNTDCKSQTGFTLSYVKFGLPTASRGKLYYDYTENHSGTAITTSGRYYRNSTPVLSKVFFVPASGYVGTVEVPYTAYDIDGNSYSSAVKVMVNDTISYQSANGVAVDFDGVDFNRAARNITGETLAYVKFTLPSSREGTLYYNYSGKKDYDSVIGATSKYYYKDTPDVSKVSFVPAPGFSGTVTIAYEGRDVDANSFSGRVEIKVIPGKGGTSLYFRDVGANHKWAAEAIDALYEKDIVTGVDTKNFNPQGNITRGDFMLMLYRAFDFKTNFSGGSFQDVRRGSYYYDAITTAKALGIAKGFENTFQPDEPLVREDAMVLVVRTLEMTGRPLAVGRPSELAPFLDSQQVSGYAKTALATLIRAGLIQGNDGVLNPKSNMTRAEMSVFLYRVITR